MSLNVDSVSKKFGRYAEAAGGITLIVIAIKILMDHTG